MLATLEKILMPLQAKSKNFLATTYFHRGYEISLTEIGKRSRFDRVIVGNGMEGTTSVSYTHLTLPTILLV